MCGSDTQPESGQWLLFLLINYWCQCSHVRAINNCAELWQTQGSCCTFASLTLHQQILTTDKCVRYSGVAKLNSKKAKPRRCSAKMRNQRRTWLPPGWLWGMAECSGQGSVHSPNGVRYRALATIKISHIWSNVGHLWYMNKKLSRRWDRRTLTVEVLSTGTTTQL